MIQKSAARHEGFEEVATSTIPALNRRGPLDRATIHIGVGMLRISKGQLEVFEELAHEQFRWRLVQFLFKEMSEELTGLSKGEVYKRVVSYESAAATYGVQTEQGFAMFASLSIALGHRVDELPEVRDYLKQAGGEDPEELLAKLVDFLD
jgi:hypothetical protein